VDVSIIIVSYNTSSLLRNCINSIYEQTVDVNFEIIVVDNDSKDGSCDMLKQDFKSVKLIENKQNLGFGKANNVGAKIAAGKYLFFLNSDIILLNNAVKVLFSFLEEHAEAKIAGGALYGADGQPNVSAGNFPSLLQEFSLIGFAVLYKRYYKKHLSSSLVKSDKEPCTVDYISGADLMIEKKAFDELKGFDEDFFLYYEETEMSFRARKMGWLSYFVPDAKIVHLESASFSSRSKIPYYRTSRKLFFKKCYGNNSLYLLKLYVALSNITHSLFEKKTR
jgi:GT2 family glycosyltransferase